MSSTPLPSAPNFFNLFIINGFTGPKPFNNALLIALVDQITLIMHKQEVWSPEPINNAWLRILGTLIYRKEYSTGKIQYVPI